MPVGGFCSQCWMPVTPRTASRKPRRPKCRRCGRLSAFGPMPSHPCSLEHRVTMAWLQFLLPAPMAGLPPVVQASAPKHLMTVPVEGTLVTRQPKTRAGTMAVAAKPNSTTALLLNNNEPCPALDKGNSAASSTSLLGIWSSHCSFLLRLLCIPVVCAPFFFFFLSPEFSLQSSRLAYIILHHVM